MTRYIKRHAKLTILLVCAGLLSACAEQSIVPEAPKAFVGGEAIAARHQSYVPLTQLPARSKKINIAVYDFPDLTGANASNENFADFSKAVTQGADALVVEALNDVGGGTWFRVLERRFSEAVLNERRIVQAQSNEAAQRAQVASERRRLKAETDRVDAEHRRMMMGLEQDYARFAQQGDIPEGYPSKAQAIANLEGYRSEQLRKIEPERPFSVMGVRNPLTNLATADYLITGAIVAFDSDVESGGTGLRLSNIGFRQERRKDIITVNLRIVDVGSGEVLANKTVTQAVLSVRKQGDTLNYVTLNTVLEFESGLVVNEPATFALDAAIRVALSGALLALKH